MPFVALYLIEDDEDTDERKKEILLIFLSCSLAVWVILNFAFFCTIDLSFANTFIGIETAPACCIAGYQDCKTDSGRFAWVFGARLSYTKPIHDEVRTWVAENIAGWKEEKPDWFNIELIPDDMLPDEVLESEGGAARKRRRSSVSLRELVVS